MIVEIKQKERRIEIVKQAADIVSAYVSNHVVPASDLPRLIAQVHEALHELRAEKRTEVFEPAVPMEKAVGRDYVVCLACGAKQKVLRRHIHAAHGLSDQEYCDRYHLSQDIPFVAPAYARERSQWAKKMGLGRKRAKRAKVA